MLADLPADIAEQSTDTEIRSTRRIARPPDGQDRYQDGEDTYGKECDDEIVPHHPAAIFGPYLAKAFAAQMRQQQKQDGERY